MKWSELPQEYRDLIKHTKQCDVFWSDCNAAKTIEDLPEIPHAVKADLMTPFKTIVTHITNQDVKFLVVKVMDNQINCKTVDNNGNVVMNRFSIEEVKIAK